MIDSPTYYSLLKKYGLVPNLIEEIEDNRFYYYNIYSNTNVTQLLLSFYPGLCPAEAYYQLNINTTSRYSRQCSKETFLKYFQNPISFKWQEFNDDNKITRYNN